MRLSQRNLCLVTMSCLAVIAGAARTRSMPMAQPNSCGDEERAAIERGESFGMAASADRNGYPGPERVLALAAELKLSPDQIAALKKLQSQRAENAVARGKEMFAAETRLEEMFREERPEADLREQSFRIDSLHAELRWVHLLAHVATHALLTREQLGNYRRLSGSAGDARPAHDSFR
jgi:hypothetical protein